MRSEPPLGHGGAVHVNAYRISSSIYGLSNKTGAFSCVLFCFGYMKCSCVCAWLIWRHIRAIYFHNYHITIPSAFIFVNISAAYILLYIHSINGCFCPCIICITCVRSLGPNDTYMCTNLPSLAQTMPCYMHGPKPLSELVIIVSWPLGNKHWWK